MIYFGFQVEEEASDKDNKNCSNNGKRQTFFFVNSDLLSTQSLDYISLKAWYAHPAGWIIQKFLNEFQL